MTSMTTTRACALILSAGLVACGSGDPAGVDADPEPTDAVRLAGPDARFIAFSTDDSTIVWSRTTGDATVLAARRLDTGEVTDFATADRLATSPGFFGLSADGEVAAYVDRPQDTTESLVVARTDGTFVRQLGPIAVSIGFRRSFWLVDARTLIYWTLAGDAAALHHHDVDTGADAVVATVPIGEVTSALEPAQWSPSGRRALLASGALVYDVDQRVVYPIGASVSARFLDDDTVVRVGGGTATRWTLSTGAAIELVTGADAVGVSADGRYAVATYRAAGPTYRTELVDARDGAAIAICAPAADACQAEVLGSVVRVFEPGRGTTLRALATGTEVPVATDDAFVSISPDGDWSVVRSEATGSARLLALAAPAQASTIAATDELAWWPENGELVVTSSGLTPGVHRYALAGAAAETASVPGQHATSTPDRSAFLVSNNTLPGPGVFRLAPDPRAAPQLVFRGPDDAAADVRATCNTHAAIATTTGAAQELWLVPVR